MDDPLVGSVLAGYRIVRAVGRGGMGVVYEAVELALDRTVALKVIASEVAADAAFRRRFAEEARVAASIDHPNVVPVFGAGEEGERLFLTMRFVVGDDLGTMLRRDGPLAPGRAALIVRQVAAALEAAHGRGLVHRDVKPANVLVGPGDHTYLTDFGLAKHVASPSVTRTGVVVGTPDYMAPEQIKGEPTGPWTDVYALGCVLFFALTGRVVYALANTEAKLWAHLSAPPPPAPAFDAVVRAALAKDPSQRLASAAAFARALAECERRDAVGRVEAAVTRTAAGRREWRAAESELTGTIAALHVADTRTTSGAHGVCPFKGLAAFEYQDARYFFGRERLIAELVARLVGSPLLAIIGASGSGKSSLLRAGLLPALAAGVLPGSDGWPQVLMRPGAHPLRELERVLLDDEHVVVAVDQFEELFTACRDEDERAAFVRALMHDRRGVVIVVVRGDFYERCAAFPELSEAMASSQVLVAPMRRHELRQAIERPAERAGLQVEPELAEALLADVETEPGGLPLLSTVLLELWEQRHGDSLQLATYERTGGVRRAVARVAEDAYARLSAEEQELSRRLLLRLAGEDDAGAVRRRVPLIELGENLREVAALLAERRLLTISEGSVEVAHEALFREWPRLRGWLEQDADGRRLHQRLSNAARDWAERGRDPGELFRGARLAATLEWQRSHPAELAPTEREFLARAAEDEARELLTVRRRTRRLRTLAGGLALLVLATGALAVLAIGQSQRADAARRTAVSRDLAAESVANLSENLDVAALLSLEAYEFEPTLEARAAALSVLGALMPQRQVLRGHTGPVTAVALRRGGRMLISGGVDGTVRFWDLNGGRQTRFLRPAGNLPITGITLSPDDRRLGVSTLDGTLRIYDLQRPTATPPSRGGYERTISSIAFSPRGDLLAAGTRDGLVRFWSASTQREVARQVAAGGGSYVGALAFTPTGDRVAAGDDDGSVRLWDTATRRPVGSPLRGNLGRVNALAFSPDGSVLVAAGTSGAIRQWDTHDWRGRSLRAGVGTIYGLAFQTPDTIVVAGENGSVTRWDLRSGRALGQPLGGHAGTVTVVAAGADGALISGGADGTIRRWSVDDRGSILRAQPGGVSGLDVGVATLATGGADWTVRIWDLRTRRPLGQPRRAPGPVTGVAFAAGGELVAATATGQLQFWDGGGHSFGPPVNAHLGALHALAFDPRSDRLLLGGEQTASVWDARTRGETGPLLGGLGGRQLTAVAADPTARLVATAGEDGAIRLWDARTHRPHGLVLQGSVLPVRAIAFSPDGRTLASAGDDATIRLWDVDTGRPRGQPLAGHRSAIVGVAYTPDGRTLASADASGTLRLWDPLQRRQLGQPLMAHSSTVTGVRFSENGTFLATAGADGTVHLWDHILWSSDLDTIRRRICGIIARSLTRGEWHEYLPDHPYHATCRAP